MDFLRKKLAEVEGEMLSSSSEGGAWLSQAVSTATSAATKAFDDLESSEALSRELEGVRRELAAAHAEIHRLSLLAGKGDHGVADELEGLRTELAAARAQIHRLRPGGDAESLEEEARVYREEAVARGERLREVAAELAKVKEALGLAEQRAETAEQSATAAEERAADLDAKRLKLKSLLQRLSDAKGALEEKLKQSNEELEHVRLNLAEALTGGAAAAVTGGSFGEKHGEAQDSGKAIEEQQQMRAELAAAHLRIDELSQAAAVADERAAAAERRAMAAETAAMCASDGANAEESALHEALRAAKAEMLCLGAAVADSDVRLQAAQARADEMESRSAEVEAASREIGARFSTIQVELRSLQDDLAEAQTALRANAAELESKTAKLQSMADELTQKTSQLEANSSQLACTEIDVQDLHAQLAAARNEAATASRRIAEMEAELAGSSIGVADGHLASLRAALEAKQEAEAEARAARAEANARAAAYEALEAQLNSLREEKVMAQARAAPQGRGGVSAPATGIAAGTKSARRGKKARKGVARTLDEARTDEDAHGAHEADPTSVLSATTAAELAALRGELEHSEVALKSAVAAAVEEERRRCMADANLKMQMLQADCAEVEEASARAAKRAAMEAKVRCATCRSAQANPLLAASHNAHGRSDMPLHGSMARRGERADPVSTTFVGNHLDAMRGGPPLSRQSSTCPSFPLTPPPPPPPHPLQTAGDRSTSSRFPYCRCYEGLRSSDKGGQDGGSGGG